MGEHETRHSGGEEAADHGWHELGGDEKRRLSADLQQEAPAEVNPDSEGTPSDADKSHRVHDWFREHRDWNQGRDRACFDPDKSDEAEHTNDEQEVYVWCIPAEQWSVIPRNIEEHQPGNSQYGTRPVHARSVSASLELRIVSKRLGDRNDREDGKAPASESI